MSDIDINAPLGWRVSAIDGRKDWIDGYKNEPWQEDFRTRPEADAHKTALQGMGHVATVTPIYMSPQQRGKHRKKAQSGHLAISAPIGS